MKRSKKLPFQEAGSIQAPITIPKREREILELAAQGRTDKEISSMLNISTETVSTYWRRIRQRYQAASRTEVVAHAMRDQANLMIAQVASENERLAQEVARREVAESMLAESEAWLRSILGQAPLMIAAVTAEGNVLFTNNGYLQERADLGQTAFDVIRESSPQVAQEIQGAIERVLQTCTPVAFEIQFPQPDGSLEDFEIRIGPNPGMTPEQVIVLAGRITERRHAERQLSDSELQFTQVADKVNAVLWVSDVATHQLLYLSPSYEDVWGISIPDAIQDRARSLDLIHPEDRHKAGISVFDCGPTEVTYRIIRPDGEVRRIWDRTFPIIDANGKTVRMAGIAEDITHLALLTEQNERQQELQALVSSIAQAMAVTHPENGDQVIQFALQRAAEGFKCERAVVVRYCADCSTASMTHEFFEVNLPSVSKLCQDLPLDSLHEVTAAFQSQGALQIASRDEVEKQSLIAEMMVAKGIDAVLAVPMAIDGKIHGFFAVETSGESRSWSHEEKQAMTALGQMIGSTLARQDAYLAIQEDAARRKRLLELLADTAEIEDSRSLFSSVFSKLGDVLQYDNICILGYDAVTHTLEEVLWEGHSGERSALRGIQLIPGKGLIGTAFQEGKALLVNHAHRDPRSVYPPDSKIPSEHLMVIPIQPDGVQRGAVVVTRHEMLHPFTEAEFDVAQTYVAFMSLKVSLFLQQGLLDVRPWNTVGLE